MTSLFENVCNSYNPLKIKNIIVFLQNFLYMNIEHYSTQKMYVEM